MWQALRSVFALGSLLVSAGAAETAPATLPAEASAGIFDEVWQILADEYFDPTFHGVDWPAARAKLRPAALAAADSPAALRLVVAELLAELPVSHLGLLPGEAAPWTDSAAAAGGAQPPLEWVHTATGQFLVRRSLGELRVQPGWELLAVGDLGIADLRQRLAREFKAQHLVPWGVVRSVEHLWNGPVGTAVSTTWQTLDGATVTVDLTRVARTQTWSAAFGNLPPQPIEFESRPLPQGMLYLRFSVWVPEMMVRLRQALAETPPTGGLIIDLRGNSGGIGGMAMGLAGLVADRPFSLGRMHLRSGFLNFAVAPQRNTYTGPVALLLDGGSASTSEIFAGGLREAGRARLFGTPTAGAALPSYFRRLSSGDVLQYAVADFRLPSGQLLEGHGIMPDAFADWTPAALASGEDPALAAALAWLAQTPQATTGAP